MNAMTGGMVVSGVVLTVFGSARRPGHGPAAENVEMQVEDGLSRLGAVIHDQPAVFRAVFPGQLRADADDLADERLVLGGNRPRAAEMFLGNDQKMGGRLGGDVPEGNDLIVLMQFFGRDFTAGDPAEKTGAAHPFLLVSRGSLGNGLAQDTVRAGFCQM